jgi:UDP-glucose 4-epimerase
MKILITGGSGFIGSHLVKFWQIPHVDVIIFDNQIPPERLSGYNYTFIQGTITDREKVANVMRGVDYVFHLAAEISVPESMDNPLKYYGNNTIGTIILLEEAEKAKVKHFVFASSSANYGYGLRIPKKETMLLRPKCPYAFTKIDGEYMCEMFRKERGLKTTSLRFFNVYGEGQNPDAQYAAAVPKFVQQCLNNEKITLFGGSQTRDFIYVGDIVKGMVFCVMNKIEGIFNLGTGKNISIENLAILIRRLTKSISMIDYLPVRAGDVPVGLAGMKRLEKRGFICDYTLEQGIQKVITYFQNPLSFDSE